MKGPKKVPAYAWRDYPLPRLHQAARRADEEAVRALLGECAAVDASTDWGDTALHWAAVGGNVGVVQALLAAGADVASASCCPRSHVGGFSTLHWASSGGLISILRVLLTAGADVAAATDTMATRCTAVGKAAAQRHYRRCLTRVRMLA